MVERGKGDGVPVVGAGEVKADRMPVVVSRVRR